MALLARYLSPTRSIVALRSRSKEGAIRELTAALRLDDPLLDAATIAAAVHEREKLVSSWIGGIAISRHARMPGLAELQVVVGRSKRGVAWELGSPRQPRARALPHPER